MPLVAGRVLAGDGTPAAGVQVGFAAAPVAVPDIAALTAADGAFSLTAPAAGAYRLFAHGLSGSAELAVTVEAQDITDLELRVRSEADDPPEG